MKKKKAKISVGYIKKGKGKGLYATYLNKKPITYSFTKRGAERVARRYKLRQKGRKGLIL